MKQKINPTDEANKYIAKHSKTKLSKKLGISRPTLDDRLLNQSWTLNEIKELMKINKP